MRTRSALEHSRCTTCHTPSDDTMCARCRDARDLLPDGIEVGDWVRLPGEAKVYRLHGFHRDGSARCYGGDKNPKGHRAWRALPTAALVVADSPYGEGREDEDG